MATDITLFKVCFVDYLKIKESVYLSRQDFETESVRSRNPYLLLVPHQGSSKNILEKLTADRSRRHTLSTC